MSRRIAALAASAVLCAINPALAQDPAKFEWSQTLNLPKGQNLPAGVKADILGIELGASYAEVKPVIESLVKEVRPRGQAKPDDAITREAILGRIMGQATGESDRGGIDEREIGIALPMPSGSQIEASYVGVVIVTRSLPGSGKSAIDEEISIQLSAPSSGHQVLQVGRLITYHEPRDQPRISEISAALKAKFKAEPAITRSPSSETHSFGFGNGVARRPDDSVVCRPMFHYTSQSRDIPGINRNRACDVVMSVSFGYGLSKDHAGTVTFALADNERAKADTAADYAFFEAYVKKLAQTRGKPPKL